MCNLKIQAMDRAGELPLETKMDEEIFSKPLDNLSSAAVRGEAVAEPKTIGELFASVGGWMNGGELGYPSFGSMDALRIFTQRSIRAALATAPLPQVRTIPAERATTSTDARDQAHAAGWNACRAAVVAGMPQVQSEAPDEASIECWSADEEDFNATELDSLLTTHGNLKPGDTVWVGEAIRPEPSQLIDADDILTMMGERAHDIAGEHAEDYPDVSKEAEQELNALLAAWIGKHASPSFWTVANIRPHVLTHDDFPNESTQIQRDVLAVDGEVTHG